MSTAQPHGGEVHPTLPPSSVPAWMDVGEARAVLAGHGLRSLPVHGHGGLVGLITVEALSGGPGGPPDAARPVAAVMDWHLVHVPAGADEAAVLHAFSEAAWCWMRTRRDDAHATREA